MSSFAAFFLLELSFGYAVFNLGRWFQWASTVPGISDEDLPRDET